MLIRIILLFCISIPIYAGINGLTHHSRANCLSINESISWDAHHKWWVTVTSTHLPPNSTKPVHWSYFPENDGYPPVNPARTWRGAAMHIGEACCGWLVSGYHEIYKKGYSWKLVQTDANDCSVYDGWWDKDHPDRASDNTKEKQNENKN